MTIVNAAISSMQHLKNCGILFMNAASLFSNFSCLLLNFDGLLPRHLYKQFMRILPWLLMDILRQH